MRHSDEQSIPSGARGLLDRQRSAQHFALEHIEPSASLQHLIQRFWVVRWDLRDKPDYEQENLPHPNVHLVVDASRECHITGVRTGKFTYRLAGKGMVVGAKFWAGAFSALSAGPISELTEKRVPLRELWPDLDERSEARIAEGTNVTEVIRDLEEWLQHRAKPLDEAAVRVRHWVRLVEENRGIGTVEQLSAECGTSVRSLQRLFLKYVGVSPKWVIDRYRIIEAVEQLNNNQHLNLADLAQFLGYFDQAHFSKTFKALVGAPPSYFLR